MYGFHISRHSSGAFHYASQKFDFFKINSDFGKRVNIASFQGIEYFGTQGFGCQSLPELFNEIKFINDSNTFVFDMREYEGKPFNMTIAIMTESGISKFKENWKNYTHRKFKIFEDNHLNIGVMICSYL